MTQPSPQSSASPTTSRWVGDDGRRSDGWLSSDDWLLRGGPLGGILGFAIGGSLLPPIGYVCGKLVAAMPDAAGEVAYTAKVFPRSISYATGWMDDAAYFIVCPWEAVAVGRIAAYIFPGLDSLELYRIAGKPVFLPRLIIRSLLTGLLTLLNYRGIRLSATFQNWTSFGTIRPVRHLRWGWREQGVSNELHAIVFTHAIPFDLAGDANRPLFHDRVRVGYSRRPKKRIRNFVRRVS